MRNSEIIYTGKPLAQAEKVLIMLHGRGGSANDILSLQPYLHIKDFAILVPQAAEGAWYPYSFLNPPHQNEPRLSSALQNIYDIILNLNGKGLLSEQIHILGFSQGACLTLEFAARHAGRYGGLVAFTGGLIGDRIYKENYRGDFKQTPVFIGTGDPDPHIPVERVRSSSELLQKMNAEVTLMIYRNRGHTICQDEIDKVNQLIFSN